MKPSACATLPTQPENQVWFRAIQPQHWHTALATAHTSKVPSRYNFANADQPGFPNL